MLLLTTTFAAPGSLQPSGEKPETKYVTEEVKVQTMQTVIENQVGPRGLKICGSSPPAHMAARNALTHEPHATLVRPARRELGSWSRLALGEAKFSCDCMQLLTSLVSPRANADLQ